VALSRQLRESVPRVAAFVKQQGGGQAIDSRIQRAALAAGHVPPSALRSPVPPCAPRRRPVANPSPPFAARANGLGSRRGRFVFRGSALADALSRRFAGWRTRPGPFRETGSEGSAIERYIVGWPAGLGRYVPLVQTDRVVPRRSVCVQAFGSIHALRHMCSSPRPPRPVSSTAASEAPRSSPRGASLFSGRGHVLAPRAGRRGPTRLAIH
jgi:hypothetical protein